MNWAKLKRQLWNARRSWTVQFNNFVGSAALALPYAEQQFPAMKPFIPENVYMYALGVVVFVNILLRFKTNTPLENR